VSSTEDGFVNLIERVAFVERWLGVRGRCGAKEDT
jgi:hypothetical protein